MSEYDVAFSLLGKDEPIAKLIQDRLPPELKPFLYTEEQRELIAARDGLEAVPTVFREARLCVILFRGGWGDTIWTRLEKQTIGDRFMGEGSKFLLLVRLDTAELPAWFPRTDLWVDYSKDGPQKTADYIVARLENVVGTGASRSTARSYDRRPAPIARYQVQQLRITEQYTPVIAELCDGCTAAVEFRPLVRVQLPAHEHWPPVTEQLCPRCARDRGIRITIPTGMTEEQVYAGPNPTFRQHLIRLLKDRILGILSEDAILRNSGVSRVGAMISSQGVTLLISGSWNEPKHISICVRDMEARRIGHDTQIVEYLRRQILRTLDSEAAS